MLDVDELIIKKDEIEDAVIEEIKCLRNADFYDKRSSDEEKKTVLIKIRRKLIELEELFDQIP